MYSRKFTDFKFQELDDENYKIIENKMIEKGKLIRILIQQKVRSSSIIII